MFISFEGVDGSGKTTQVALLADSLREEGRDVVATREPGGTPAGERIRELLLEGGEIAPWTEAALFAAARAASRCSSRRSCGVSRSSSTSRSLSWTKV